MTDDQHGSTTPRSTEGRLLAATLRGDAEAVQALTTATDTHEFLALLRQTFIVAVQRRFACEPDARVITRYIAEALPRRNFAAAGIYAREAEGLVRSVLGEEGLDEGIRHQDAVDLVFAILADLVKQGGQTGDLDAMIVLAEARHARDGVVVPAATSTGPKPSRWSRVVGKGR